MKKYFGLLFVFVLLVSTVAAQKHSGTYYRPRGTGDITIKEFQRGKFINFTLSVGGEKGYLCIGRFSGKAKWISPNIAEFNTDFSEKTGCRLTFIFSGNRVTIREKDCGRHHGAGCNFEGTYTRAVKRKNKR